MAKTDALSIVAYRVFTVPVTPRTVTRNCNPAAPGYPLLRSDSTSLLSASMSA